MAAILHKHCKLVGRFEWPWCPFACFKGCWNHKVWLCSPM